MGNNRKIDEEQSNVEIQRGTIAYGFGINYLDIFKVFQSFNALRAVYSPTESWEQIKKFKCTNQKSIEYLAVIGLEALRKQSEAL